MYIVSYWIFDFLFEGLGVSEQNQCDDLTLQKHEETDMIVLIMVAIKLMRQSISPADNPSPVRNPLHSDTQLPMSPIDPPRRFVHLSSTLFSSAGL